MTDSAGNLILFYFYDYCPYCKLDTGGSHEWWCPKLFPICSLLLVFIIEVSRNSEMEWDNNFVLTIDSVTQDETFDYTWFEYPYSIEE